MAAPPDPARPDVRPDARTDARTDAFRHDPRTSRIAVALLGALLLLTVAAAAFGPGFDPESADPVWAGLAAAFLLALLAAHLWVARRRPVLLRVGPAGIDLPLAFARPLAWAEVHRIRRLPPSGGILGRRHWLVVDPLPGVLPDYRLPGPRPVERWLMRRWGLNIPLHALDASPEEVVASIERFRPVVAQPR